MFRDAIINFPRQFAYEPVVENGDGLGTFRRVIVAGMGGSHWAADLLKVWNPYLDVVIHHDYGLPSLSDSQLKECLIIISSYSGTTEETLDAYEKAKECGLPRAAISVGGKLLMWAKNDGIPYVQIPDTGIQPRSALGFSFRALLRLMREEDALAKTRALAGRLEVSEFQEEGRGLAERLWGRVPIVYASGRNAPLASIWKIKFNETGKIPAFSHVFPELNHNEMTGFDVKENTRPLSHPFSFLILRDEKDDPRVLKRMEVLERLYHARGLPVEVIELRGEDIFQKIFSSLILVDWTSYFLAEHYGVEPEEVPMVEEFKKLMVG